MTNNIIYVTMIAEGVTCHTQNVYVGPDRDSAQNTDEIIRRGNYMKIPNGASPEFDIMYIEVWENGALVKVYENTDFKKDSWRECLDYSYKPQYE